MYTQFGSATKVSEEWIADFHAGAVESWLGDAAEPDFEGDRTAPPESTPREECTTLKRSRDEVSDPSGVRGGAYVVGANHVNPLQDGGGFGSDGAE
jgi:hypothetical protein